MNRFAPVEASVVVRDEQCRYLLVGESRSPGEPRSWTIPRGRLNSYMGLEHASKGSVVSLSGVDIELTKDEPAGEVRVAASDDSVPVLLGRLGPDQDPAEAGLPVTWEHITGAEALLRTGLIGPWVYKAIQYADVTLGW